MSVISIENAEHYHWGEFCDGWHLVKSDALSVIQERVPCGCSEIRHYHEMSKQFFFVLSGIATSEVDGIAYKILPNHGIHVPVGEVHQLSNQHETELCFIVTSTPPSHGGRVES